MSTSERIPSWCIRAVSEGVAAWLGELLSEPFACRGPILRGTGAVARFERMLAERCGFPYCLATCNATTGLLAVALATSLPRKRMIVPAKAWPGSVGPFQLAGTEVVKVRCKADGTLDPGALAELAEPSPAAILAVDWKGHRHDAKAIRQICEERGWLYIEDSSWLPGVSAPVDRPSLADVQVISFGPGKPLCLGEGGAVLVRSSDLYESLVAVSQHPERMSREDIAMHPAAFQINGRIHPLAAVMGLELLNGIEAGIRRPHGLA